MTGSIDVQGPRVEFSLDVLARGRPLPPGVADALVHLFGARVGRDGLSRAFQPAFPGVRSYAIHTRLLPDRSVGLEVVGLARSGAPVWVGERTFARGHDGSIELHHGAEDAEPDPQSRNMLTDVMRRELALLDTLDAGPGARITHDAQGASSYRYALHGFVFADETEEGVPVRSRRALEPSGDRSRLVVAMIPLIERLGRQHGASPTATASAVDAIRAAETPGDMALVEFSDVPLPVPEGERGVAGGLGRALLTSPELPDWRAALFVRPSPGRTRGDTYRRQEADDHERRLASDVREALDQLAAKPHVARIRALRTLGRMAGNWVLPEIRKMASAPHRGVAAVARQTLTQISGADFALRIREYAMDSSNPVQKRARCYRVLTEHYPSAIADEISMLRVNPDARIQRVVVPSLIDDAVEAGPARASFLAANPWSDIAENRPGLLDLRLEILEYLARFPDPRTLPALMGALNSQPAPPPAEAVALSRALVAHNDPRARKALAAIAERLDRPPVP